MSEKISKYQPLIVVIAIIVLASAALEVARGGFDFRIFMINFMGFFFLIFSMFKFFDIHGFTNGFRMYDIIAKQTHTYAYIYPFIELALGVLYLSRMYLYTACIITLVVMFISAIGVIRSVTSGMNLKCACLGTALNVPLSTVSIIENIGMGLMAAYMLIH